MQALNDFLERHSEELRLELGREDSLPSPEETEGLEQEEGQKEAEWGERGGAEQENKSDLEEEGRQEPSFEDGEFSERVHELYREFLRVVTANLEGILQYFAHSRTNPARAADRQNRERTLQNRKIMSIRWLRLVDFDAAQDEST